MAGKRIVLAAALLAACRWVPLTVEGEQVRVANAAEVEGCQDLGRVTGKTTLTVGPLARNEQKVAAEVEALARNEAAKMGANAIVPTGPLDWDEREYATYRCAVGDVRS
jgi:Domain of unknown function (DUF4156)